jgi:DNA polymerase I-like protein with 3'-5' exonuclease and polymerase domains
VIRIRTTSHDPGRLRNALAGAATVFVDLETTGLHRHDRIVAAGVLVDRDAHILITDEHRDLSSLAKRVRWADLRQALDPLTMRTDLVAIFHHAAFDVAMLERAGVAVNCRIHDTMKLLKIYDSDRGTEADDGPGPGSRLPRFERRYKEPMNYKLKDVARHLLSLQAQQFPGDPPMLPYDRLVRYLKSDLLVTRELYDWLQRRLTAEDRDYNARLIAPITPLLVRMSLRGVLADPDFIAAESERLLQLMAAISAAHAERFGQRLDVGDFHLRGWVYFRGLRCRLIRSGRKRLPSLRATDFLQLYHEADSAAVRDSLALLHDYKLAQSLMTRLRALLGHVDPHTRRIYSGFDDFQASGRVSSTRPNLQQVARQVGPGQKKEFRSDRFRGTVIRSRNALVASPGCKLVAFDIAQADIRNLAHAVESFRQHGEEYLRDLERRRRRRRRKKIGKFRKRMWSYFQPDNRKGVKCPHCWAVFAEAPGNPGRTVPCPKCGNPLAIPSRYPQFDPSQPCGLAEDFRRGGSDFYSVAVERMLGRKPKDASEREHMKQTILGIVNGMGAGTLARRLGVPKEAAVSYLAKFAEAYPEVVGFTEMMHHAFAVTGEAHTFAGRRRRVTAHWWLVNRPVVELFVSYKGADKLWLRVVPLEASRYTLTCWVLRVIDAKYASPNEGQEIYHHKAGRISLAPYRFFDDCGLIFRLPVRNVPWRIIRRVRTRNEEAVYEGFDRVARQLFNHVAQGGTADVAKTMMLRAEPVCRRFGAQLLLQIHDELVFEVPQRKWAPFTWAMKKALEQPPVEDFRVPVVVEPKAGPRFGEMKKLRPEDLWESRLVRLWFRVRGWLARLWKWLRRRH